MNPTNKEIASWLQEAEERFALVAKCIPEGSPFRARMVEMSILFKQRAAQVEQSDQCKCSMRTSLVGDGCRYCNPQYYIDILEDQIKEKEQSTAGRCESCRWWNRAIYICHKYSARLEEFEIPDGDKSDLKFCGPQFGCTHWEEKK